MKKLLILTIALSTVISINVKAQKKSENNKFAFELYKELIKNTSGDLVFSPYGVSQAMAMAYSGANGKTAEQMKKVMHYSANPQNLAKWFYNINKHLSCYSDTFSMAFDNQLYLQKNYKFVPSYLQLMTTQYLATLNNVNFKSSCGRKKATQPIPVKTDPKKLPLNLATIKHGTAASKKTLSKCR